MLVVNVTILRSDGPVCGYCGCLPTRHSKKDTRSSSETVSRNQEDGTSGAGTSANGSPEKWKDEDLGWFPNPKGEYTILIQFFDTCKYSGSIFAGSFAYTYKF